MTEPAVPFETHLQQLEDLVAKLERGELPLDAALEAFEKGTQLVTACKKQLELAEVRVEKILAQSASGTVNTEPFEA